MRHLIAKIANTFRNLRSEESGVASVELALVFPFFLGVFVSSFDIATINIRAVLLERATDIVVREIRLSSGATLDHNAIRTRICDESMGSVPDCENAVKIELQRVPFGDWSAIQQSADCIQRNETIQTPSAFENGDENEMMLIRVCAVVDPVFANFGIGRKIPKDESGGFQLIATSAFVNEPK